MKRALLAIGVTACAPQALAIGPRDVGMKRAKQVGDFETPSGGHHEGLTLAEGQAWSAIEDEATLVKVSDGEVCIELVTRSSDEGDYGKRLAEYEMRLLVDGVTAAISVEEGVVTAQHGSIERHGRACVRAATPRRVELVMLHPVLVHRSSVSSRISRYQLAFAWKLRG